MELSTENDSAAPPVKKKKHHSIHSLLRFSTTWLGQHCGQKLRKVNLISFLFFHRFCYIIYHPSPSAPSCHEHDSMVEVIVQVHPFPPACYSARSCDSSREKRFVFLFICSLFSLLRCVMRRFLLFSHAPAPFFFFHNRRA